ncbi:site-specific DNA-methyltransferase [Siphonobacter sp. BAB-5405]|nr:site-specific DNA-methyltransferase [Siphonobacter sp. BAB-5405]
MFKEEEVVSNNLGDINNRYSGVAANGSTWEIYNGDSLAVLKTLPNEFCDCVVTSPPYFWLRDYQSEGQLGLEDTVEEFIEKLNSVMNEIYRVLKPSGTVFINIGDTYYSGKGESQGVDKKSKKRRFGLRAVDKSGGMGIGLKPKTLIGIPWRLALKMIHSNWILRSNIIWYRKHSLPEAVKDRPKRSYEFIFMFVKKKNYYFDRTDLLEHEQEDMWTITARPKAAKGIQTAPYPDELVERCLNVGCPEGGIVLDPFSGSGTTVRVANNLRRNGIGIDLSNEFCLHAVKELQKNSL